MSRVDTEQLPDRRHLQSAQARLWCVNYSINQHMVLSRCQHLITCETLPVNGVKCVRVVWGWQVTHHVTVEASSPSEPPWHSHSICVAYVCESHRRRGRCSLLSSLYFFFLFATSKKYGVFSLFSVLWIKYESNIKRKIKTVSFSHVWKLLLPRGLFISRH